MATTSSEKVKCVHCDKVLRKRNLKDHTKNVHGEEKVGFASISSTDIRSIFGPTPSKITKNSDVEDVAIFPESPKQATSDGDLQTRSILNQLESLSLKIDSLEKSQTKIVINTADLSTVLSPKNVIEILSTCRSVELILSLLPCFTIKDNEGLRCTICEHTLKYDFRSGISFESSENLPSSFSHLKESVKRHIQSSNHVSMSALKENLSKEQKLLHKQSKEAAINCASACYLGYKLGLSYSSYEHFVYGDTFVWW